VDKEASLLELELGPAEQTAAASLCPEDLERIDNTVLSHARPKWRKIAMVVSLTTKDLRARHPELTEVFYVRRVASPVREERLEARGNLSFIRFSEVRLSDTSAKSAG
jgi:hypothetical protein